jgi:hypothetical protein
MGLHALENNALYNRVRTNQDLLTQAADEHDEDAEGELDNEDDDDDSSDMQVDPDTIPTLTEAEVNVIFNEGLEGFFESELERVVSI